MDLFEPLRVFSKSRLAGVAQAFHISEGGISAARDVLKEKFEELNESDVDHDQYRRHLEGDAAHLNQRVPNIVRSTFLLTLYAELERSMIDYLLLAYRNQGEDLPKSKHKYGWYAVKEKLSDEFSIDIESVSEDVTEIERFKELRDCIAHRRGELIEQEKHGQLGDYIRDTEGLRFNSRGDTVVVGKGYPLYIKSVIDDFFDDIIDQIKNI